uniref:ZP domain-containing protein n=1 Tax=Steinernema glaseri TaxID=37863 RepID=A0A1I7YP98_9BILA
MLHKGNINCFSFSANETLQSLHLQPSAPLNPLLCELAVGPSVMKTISTIVFSLLLMAVTADLRLLVNESIPQSQENRTVYLFVRREIGIGDNVTKCANARLEVELSSGVVLTYTVDSSSTILITYDAPSGSIEKGCADPEEAIVGRKRLSRSLVIGMEFDDSQLQVDIDKKKLPTVTLRDEEQLVAVRFFTANSCSHTRTTKSFVSLPTSLDQAFFPLNPLLCELAVGPFVMKTVSAIVFSFLFLAVAADLRLLVNESIPQLQVNRTVYLTVRREIGIGDNVTKCANARLEVELSSGVLLTYTVDSSSTILIAYDAPSGSIGKGCADPDEAVVGRKRLSRSLVIGMEFDDSQLQVDIDKKKLPTVTLRDREQLVAVRFFTANSCSHTRTTKSFVSLSTSLDQDLKNGAKVTGLRIALPGNVVVLTEPQSPQRTRTPSGKEIIQIHKLEFDGMRDEKLVLTFLSFATLVGLFVQSQVTFMRAASKKQYERKKNRSLNFMKITTARLARVQDMLKKSQMLMRAAYALPRDFDRSLLKPVQKK